MARLPHYESDDETYNAEAYRIDGHGGVAWYVLGWETEPTEDTEWDGIEERTGQLVCVMVGDDRRWTFDPEDVHPLERHEYCGGCGQIGCHADGYSEE